eukprot:COSAG01_NODE_15325_length_1348_cov_14.008807_1_plen_41_part_10
MEHRVEQAWATAQLSIRQLDARNRQAAIGYIAGSLQGHERQ